MAEEKAPQPTTPEPTPAAAEASKAEGKHKAKAAKKAAKRAEMEAAFLQGSAVKPKETAPAELLPKLKEIVIRESAPPTTTTAAAAAEAANATATTAATPKAIIADDVSKRAAKTVEDAALQDHEFWRTQPVPAFGKVIDSSLNHPIDPDSKPEDVPKEPVALPAGHSWEQVDITNQERLKEVYTLLSENYVEDDDAMFRFDYSAAFLRWALMPPGFYPSWIIGIRQDKSAGGALVGFITGIPVTLRIHDRLVRQAEINFLCVHKHHRSLRLAPLLIQEVTRRVHLVGLFQAVYTAGVVLPTPFSIARYFHRSLNPRKLIDVGFSGLSKRMTVARAVKLYHLPEAPTMPGIRPMRRTDSKAVMSMLGAYLAKFGVTPVFSEEEILHWLVPRQDVVHAYVVEDPVTKELTGMTSFYSLPSTIIGNKKYPTLRAAYSYYHVNTRGPVKDIVEQALILARQAGYDVFNALDIMENETFLKDLKFGIGDGSLNYYFYNWVCPPLLPKDLGLVLL